MNCAKCGYNVPEGAATCPSCGQTLGASQPAGAGAAPPGAPASRGWLQRNLKWAVPVGCLGIILLFALFVGGVITVVMTSFRASDVYKQALAQARANPEVQRALGLPIEPGIMVSGNISVSGPSGNATLEIPLSGPKGKGRLYLEAKKAAGKWEFQQLLVAVEGGARIDLLPETKGPTSF